jgi:hypothetical protein
MLPILLFESAWKLLWLGAVAAPLWIAGDMDAATSEVAGAGALGCDHRRGHPLALRHRAVRGEARKRVAFATCLQSMK